MKRREEEAKANMVCIIESIEHERESQRTLSDSDGDDDILKRLIAAKETMKKQNTMWWDMMKSREKDNEEYENKIEVLGKKFERKVEKMDCIREG